MTNIECPECGKHTVVQHLETRYVCLSCDWNKDISTKEPQNNKKKESPLPFFIGAGLLLALVL